MASAVHGLGCIKSPVDLRDYKLKRSTVGSTAIPIEYKLEYNHNIKNQGSVGSCTAHAIASVLEYYNINNKMSTNFIYGIRRKLYNLVGKGMTIRDGCKIVTGYGDMVEVDCRGNTEVDKVFDIAEKAFEDKTKREYAYRFKTKKYVKLVTERDIKYFIMNYGPVVAGFDWYEDFKYNKDNHVLERTDFSTKSTSSHAILIYGWDEDCWLCQNSWGIKWGNNGLFKYRYVNRLNEAYGLIDDMSLDSDTVVVDPTYNVSFLDKLYKIINYIIAKLVTH